jgi:hypothetical protein
MVDPFEHGARALFAPGETFKFRGRRYKVGKEAIAVTKVREIELAIADGKATFQGLAEAASQHAPGSFSVVGVPANPFALPTTGIHDPQGQPPKSLAGALAGWTYKDVELGARAWNPKSFCDFKQFEKFRYGGDSKNHIYRTLRAIRLPTPESIIEALANGWIDHVPVPIPTLPAIEIPESWFGEPPSRPPIAARPKPKPDSELLGADTRRAFFEDP